QGSGEKILPQAMNLIGKPGCSEVDSLVLALEEPLINDPVSHTVSCLCLGCLQFRDSLTFAGNFLVELL
ncbi:hypothetical protein, partial [Enterobacter hormaechei]|uniref:hypothetical protein n=1 Tax=Enterobacter hormaechei TaxID=158836 RepID=UPI0019530CF9